MERSGKVAIARFVFRNKEHLAALRADDGVLTLTTMRFADEVVPPDELDDVLPAEKPKVAKKEVEMAEKLIDSLTSDFDPSAYRDEYREELMSLIERKAEGKEIVAPEAAEPEATKAPDLMAALEESIAAVKGKADGKAPETEAKAEESRAEKSRRQETLQSQSPPSSRVGTDRQVEVDGRELKLTNLDKVLYPKAGFTKGEVVDYYAKVADGDGPPPERPGGDAAPLPGRSRRPRLGLLREALPQAPAEMGEDGVGAGRARTPARSTSASATACRP